MTPNVWLTILGIVVAAAGSYGAARFAGKSSVKIAKETNAVTFSRDLMARLESLEDDVQSLRKDLNKVNRTFGTAVNFIERFMLWARAGSNPPMPIIPESLKEHIDPSVIQEHGREYKKSQSHDPPNSP